MVIKYLFILFILFLIACSSIKVSKRQGKDVALSLTNSYILNGIYSNKMDSSTSYSRLLWGELSDSSGHIKNVDSTIVQIETIDKSKLKFTLLLNDSSIGRIELNGVYKNGYFYAKRNKARLEFGPIWTYDTKKIFLGLTKGNDLVVTSSSSNTAFLILFPIGGAGDNNIVTYFHRLN